MKRALAEFGVSSNSGPKRAFGGVPTGASPLLRKVLPDAETAIVHAFDS